MKISKLIVLAIILYPVNLLFGQTDSSNFLKEYKAPDYKFHSLILDFKSNGEGKINSSNLLSSSVNLNYNSNENTTKIQGSNSFRLGTALSHENQTSITETMIRFDTRHSMMKKIYLTKNNWFVGFSDYALVGQHNGYIKDSINYNGLALRVNPTFFIGKGRLEPVYYARKSNDIENALLKSNSITNEMTVEQKTTLANIVVKLQRRRFYDSRINRIYQFEILDSTLQAMGIIDDVGITYFAHLNDAFSYTHDAKRFSGKQFRFGLSQSFTVFEQSLFPEMRVKIFGLGGFVSYEYHLPASYKIQHYFKSGFVLGKERRFGNENTFDEQFIALNFEYNFGYYPTTRTFFDIKTYLSGTQNNLICGVKSQLYYYLSPRVRASASVGLVAGMSSLNSSFYYYNPYLNQLINKNEYLKNNSYEFRIGLNYAIF